MRLVVRLTTSIFLLATLAPGVHAETSADDAAFYETQVQPILAANCFKCHGESEHPKSNLWLTAREGLLRGGDRGPSVDLNLPETSLFLHMLSYRDENHQMPPKGKLPDDEIAILTDWVNRGIPMTDEAEIHFPDEGAEDGRIAAGRTHWAFQPVTPPEVPTVDDPSWQQHPIDALVYQRLAEAGIRPAPPAPRRTLIRRAYYDLTGLPPTPEAVEAYVNDPRSYSEVWTALIDELLASPHYGEKWGRHWLDLVRYAETHGYERDSDKTGMWRYRDYVIEAFNEDTPYDQFVREQIAGDELDDWAPKNIVATGYYRLGVWDDEPADPAQGKYDVLDGIVDTTSQVFLGLTMGCARCHDHKIDPFPQTDYYKMLSIFHNITELGRNTHNVDIVRSIMTPEEQAAYDQRTVEHREELAKIEREMRDIEGRFVEKLGAADRQAAGDAPSMRGLTYKFFRDTWDEIPDFDMLLPEDEGTLEHGFFDLAPRTRNESFGFLFEGSLVVTEAGEYTFSLDSDDGSRLTVNETVVVDLNGNRGVGEPTTGTLHLTEGSHPIRLDYYQGVADLGLHVLWSGPGFESRRLSIEEKSLDVPKLLAERGEEILGEKEFKRHAFLKQKYEQRSRYRVPGGIYAPAVKENGDEPPETFVLLRGNPHVPGDKVEPGFPEYLHAPDFVVPALARDTNSTGRRRALAEWLVDPANPLPARVMANRIWQFHFGRGIVRSPNNYGLGGDLPTHPELLDWLAVEFVRQGWSMKAMHRIIMASNTYQMSARFDADAYAKDPGNDLFWRYDMRRLTAEEVRDSILAVNGTLNPKVGGPSVFPPLPPEVLATSSKPNEVWGTSPEEEHTRRSVYIKVKRSLLHPLLSDFDLADTDATCPVRFATTQPSQALNLLNSAFMNEEAVELADRLRAEATDPEIQVRLALRLVTARTPREEEVVQGLRFLEEMQNIEGLEAERALDRFCLLALNLNEFIFID